MTICVDPRSLNLIGIAQSSMRSSNAIPSLSTSRRAACGVKVRLVMEYSGWLSQKKAVESQRMKKCRMKTNSKNMSKESDKDRNDGGRRQVKLNLSPKLLSFVRSSSIGQHVFMVSFIQLFLDRGSFEMFRDSITVNSWLVNT